MASISYLQPYLGEVHEKAVEWDVQSPLIDVLQDQLIGKPFRAPDTYPMSVHDVSFLFLLAASLRST
jgi:hypothetical protein